MKRSGEVIEAIKREQELHVHGIAAGPFGAWRWTLMLNQVTNKVCNDPDRCFRVKVRVN